MELVLHKRREDLRQLIFLMFVLVQLSALQYRRMGFEEFCAATLSVHQLEALDRWEQHARAAYEIFEKEGNRPLLIEELASVCSFILITTFI